MWQFCFLAATGTTNDLLRSRLQAYVGGRLDYLVSTRAFEQVLRLPSYLTEKAPIGSQASRLRSFETIREFFTSPLASVLLDLPFIPLFVFVMALVAGPVAIVPVVALVIYAAVAFLVFPKMKKRADKAGIHRAERHSFIIEMLTQMRAIKQLGAEEIWLERYRETAANTAAANFRTAAGVFIVQNISHVLMVSSGAATMAVAIIGVIEGFVSPGALIAVMALTWRVLSPIQAGFNLVQQIEQLRLVTSQLTILLRAETESEPTSVNVERKVFDGALRIHRVSLRYAPNAEPALSGVDLAIPPGQFVAIAGASGAGKSSLFKLLLNIYRPQAGAILIDGIDIQQISPIDLRRSIGYVPQVAHQFYGTIAQNLRLADPAAEQGELEAICEKVGILDDIRRLPEGFNTRFGDNGVARLPSGFVQRLAIAAALLRNPTILLLDEAHDGLDEDGDRLFMETLAAMQGQVTVLLATHRPSHMRAADRVIAMREGQVIADGLPDDVVPKLLKSFSTPQNANAPQPGGRL